MACALPSSTTLELTLPATPRKRTISFCAPRPNKGPRTSTSLRRTSSYRSLPDRLPESASHAGTSGACSAQVSRSLRTHKDSYMTTTTAIRNEVAHLPIPSSSSSSLSLGPFHGTRLTSPLAPVQRVLPARRIFPRSKREPDLYRTAITACMRETPQGQRFLYMGARLTASIFAATQALEHIVASQTDEEGNWTLGKSWVVVPHDDWEIVR